MHVQVLFILLQTMYAHWHKKPQFAGKHTFILAKKVAVMIMENSAPVEESNNQLEPFNENRSPSNSPSDSANGRPVQVTDDSGCYVVVSGSFSDSGKEVGRVQLKIPDDISASKKEGE